MNGTSYLNIKFDRRVRQYEQQLSVTKAVNVYKSHIDNPSTTDTRFLINSFRAPNRFYYYVTFSVRRN